MTFDYSQSFASDDNLSFTRDPILKGGSKNFDECYNIFENFQQLSKFFNFFIVFLLSFFSFLAGKEASRLGNADV